MKPSRVSEGSTSAKTSENLTYPEHPMTDARLRMMSEDIVPRLHGWSRAAMVDGDPGLVKVLTEAIALIDSLRQERDTAREVINSLSEDVDLIAGERDSLTTIREERDAAIARADKNGNDQFEMLKALEAEKLHVIYCSASREAKVGQEGAGCSCPLGRTIRNLRHECATIRLREESTARQVRGETIEECAKVVERLGDETFAAVCKRGNVGMATMAQRNYTKCAVALRALASPIVAKRSGEGDKRTDDGT